MQTIKTKPQPTPQPPPPFQHIYKNIAKNILNKKKKKNPDNFCQFIFVY